eukprot:scaffold4357_cov97-Skeletonema_dohrnii-CCMP3373.AAC.1
MLLYYYGRLSWVTRSRSCGLSYSQRQIRFGRQQRSLRPSQMSYQTTYVIVATPIRSINA